MADAPHTDEPNKTAETPDQPANAEDDIKDRFKAALDRKRGEAKARSAQGHGAGNPKVHEAGRAGGKRTFRRKSG